MKDIHLLTQLAELQPDLGAARSAPLRSSPLSTWQECKRKFMWAYRYGVQPKRLERALNIGSIVHKILQCLLLDQSTEEALAVAQSDYEKWRQELMGWADKAGFLPGGEALESTLANLEEDYHKARAMALCFYQFTPFDWTKWEVYRDPDGNPMVERLLTAHIDGPPSWRKPLAVRTPCDLVLRQKGTSELWIVDFKTTSFSPKVRAIPTKISPQLRLYRWVLSEQLKEWGKDSPDKLVGSIHAIIKKPTIKYCPKTKDKEGFQSYLKRLVEWYKDAETKAPEDPPLIFDYNRFSGPALDAELYNLILKYYNDAVRDVYYTQYPRAGESTCLSYNRPCAYMPLCNSSPALWPLIVHDHYTRRFREDTEGESNEY